MNKDLVEKVKAEIRDVVDFPKEGIVFKDISPIMLNPTLSNEIVEHLASVFKNQGITKIAGIESRGFLLGYPLAMRLGLPFVLIRKKGKLPYKKVSYSYDLEYGSATIEMHEDAVEANDNVLVHDDLLATGGSAQAAAHLIQECGAKVAGFSFLVSLEFLGGDQKLKPITQNIDAIVKY